jgi:hypothetical protein
LMTMASLLQEDFPETRAKYRIVRKCSDKRIAPDGPPIVSPQIKNQFCSSSMHDARNWTARCQR